MKILDVIKTALFTKRCALCGEVVEVDETFCEDCKNPPVITGEICKSCGCAIDDCSCKKNKNEYKQIISPFYYEDSVVKAINSYKEREMLFIADYLSKEMCTAISKYYSDINFDLITFVPLGELKHRTRGFNQSQLLAEKIGTQICVKTEEVIYKSRHTGTLHKNKSNVKRAAIVFGAYDVYEECKNEIVGKTILLIDDVKTTGSTLNECAKMLKIYGAKEVYALTASITKKKVK
ncbi:MAG: ComF family protein [Eubacterium sp.]|nr:ComF family protein [Eubacterium sp.]